MSVHASSSVFQQPLARSAAVLDVAIVTAGFLTTWVAASYSGLSAGGAVAVLVGLIAATWRIKARGDSWSSIGVRRPVSLKRLPLDVLALYALTIAGNLIVVQLLATLLGWSGLGLEAYSALRGDLTAYLRILAIAWTTAAFGEELLFRGFLLTRLEHIFQGVRGGTAAAIILQAFLFGIAHAYLGARGVAIATLVGLIYAAWYLKRGRNLWPLFLAHGLTDTISLTAIYAGAIPT